MKKLILIVFLLSGITLSSNAHITKSDIESILLEVGTSLEKIEEVFVYNTMSYFSDGTSKPTYSKYMKEMGNHISLSDTGIKMTYKPDGLITSVFFITYSSILTIDIGKDYISISLYM